MKIGSPGVRERGGGKLRETLAREGKFTDEGMKKKHSSRLGPHTHTPLSPASDFRPVLTYFSRPLVSFPQIIPKLSLRECLS